VREAEQPTLNTELFVAPLAPEEARRVELEKGPNIASLPDFDPLPTELDVPVLLKVGDDVSTDEIMPAGARVLPYRSNIPKISEFVFDAIDATYSRRARELGEGQFHAVVGGKNYGQGSSREHAALAPRYLGLRLVLARSFARIHWQNLVNFGILPLTLTDDEQYSRIGQGDQLCLSGLDRLSAGRELTLENVTQRYSFSASHQLSDRQIEVLRTGSLINWMKLATRDR